MEVNRSQSRKRNEWQPGNYGGSCLWALFFCYENRAENQEGLASHRRVTGCGVASSANQRIFISGECGNQPRSATHRSHELSRSDWPVRAIVAQHKYQNTCITVCIKCHMITRAWGLYSFTSPHLTLPSTKKHSHFTLNSPSILTAIVTI